MEEKDIENILQVFMNGTELNLGLFPNSIIVKYGYTYNEKELALYIQGSGKELEKIKSYVEQNKTVNFNKWSKDGNLAIGGGNSRILKTKEDRLNGFKIITRQQTGKESNNSINENEIMNLFIFEIKIKDINLIKY